MKIVAAVCDRRKNHGETCDRCSANSHRSNWKIRKFNSFEEQRTQQVKDWQALSGADQT